MGYSSPRRKTRVFYIPSVIMTIDEAKKYFEPDEVYFENFFVPLYEGSNIKITVTD